MDRTVVAGIALTAFSAIGYVVGVFFAYPGRAFSVTGMMVGVTLLAVGGGADA